MKAILGVLLVVAITAATAGSGAATQEQPHALLSVAREPATGDLDAIIERGTLRVLVEYTPTGFFIDGGRLRGFEYELVQRFVETLRKTRPDARRLNVVYVPLPFERMLSALAEGRGDLAAAAITVTSERAAKVDFSRPYLTGVRDALIAGRQARPPETLADLEGARIHVESGTSHARNALAARRTMRRAGLQPFKVVEHHIATDALLEMADSGILDYVVADDFIADLWSSVLTGVTVTGIDLASGGRIAWALRKGTPALKSAVNAYLAKNRKGSLTGNVLFKRYYESTRWIENPLDETGEVDRLNALQPYFQGAAAEQGIEWLLLAAQGYQESRLDQSVVSAAGAVGVMQILPSTAKDPVFGGADIYDAEGNIVGGARYLESLRTRYADVGGPIDPWLFAFAAYNAGPARVARARRRAEAAGYDPNRWSGNVEYTMMELVGLEPIRYVGNIQKYYIAYQLGLAAGDDRTDGPR